MTENKMGDILLLKAIEARRLAPVEYAPGCASAQFNPSEIVLRNFTGQAG
jgi:hypothetical protein